MGFRGKGPDMELPNSFKVLAAFVAALSIGWIAFLVWAIYRLVMHFTQ